MRLDQESMLGALCQAAILALSGFMFMSGLAAIGSARMPSAPSARALEAHTWEDTSVWLAQSDQAPEARASRACGTPGALQLDRADRSSARASSTSGCGSPTRSTSSASTSWRTAAASDDLPAAMSMVAYSSFAPVAKR